MEARRRAVEVLPTIPAHVLVDGKRRIAGCRLAQTPVVNADARSASIIAKAPVDLDGRAKWLERLWDTYVANAIPYIETLGEFWASSV